MKLRENSEDYNIVEIIENENIEALSWLIKNNIDLSNVNGIHAIQFAARKGKLKVLEFISDNTEADLTILSDTGKNLLHFAAEGKSLDTLIYLTDKGLNTNLGTDYGLTPLHIVSHYGFLDGVKLLIERHANVNALDVDNVASLHRASMSGHDSVITYLVKCDANIEVKDGNGSTPLYYAIENQRKTSIECLIALGANVNVQTNDKKSLLHIAVEKEYLDIVKCLIEKGADTEVEDEEESTPLGLALEGRNANIVRLLIEQGAICDYELPGDFEDISQYYLMLGELLQHLSLSETCKDFNSEMLTKAVELQIFSENDLVEFATSTIKNFALKVGAAHTCLIKIKNCTKLPEFIKLPVLELIEPLVLEARESLENLDSKLLYLHQTLSSPIPYIIVLESNKEGFADEDELSEFTAFFKDNPSYKVPGNLTLSFIYNHITEELSPLCGFMYTKIDVKEDVESLLQLCIPMQLRKALTNVLKKYNNFMQNEDEFVNLLEEVEWLPVHDGIPEAMIRGKNQTIENLALERSEANLTGEGHIVDWTIEQPWL